MTNQRVGDDKESSNGDVSVSDHGDVEDRTSTTISDDETTNECCNRVAMKDGCVTRNNTKVDASCEKETTVNDSSMPVNANKDDDDDENSTSTATTSTVALPLNEIQICGRDVEVAQLDQLFHSCCSIQAAPLRTPTVGPVAMSASASASMGTPTISNSKKGVPNNMRNSMKRMLSWNPQSKTSSTNNNVMHPGSRQNYRQHSGDLNDYNSNHQDDEIGNGAYYNIKSDDVGGGAACRGSATAQTTAEPCSCSAFVSIKGAAGVGKSALIHSRQKFWSSSKYRALVVSGKIEFQKSTKPFAAIITALEELIHLWLDSSSSFDEKYDHRNTMTESIIEGEEEVSRTNEKTTSSCSQTTVPSVATKLSDKIHQLRQMVHEVGVHTLQPILPSVIALIKDNNGDDHNHNDPTSARNGTESHTSVGNVDGDGGIGSDTSSVQSSPSATFNTGLTTPNAQSSKAAEGTIVASPPVENQSDEPGNGGNHLACLKAALWKLISFLCKPSRPVVLFLDDIQWASRDTLEILKTLALSNIPGLFLIVAYREEDVNDLHPVSLVLLDAIVSSNKQQQQLRSTTNTNGMNKPPSSSAARFAIGRVDEIKLRALDVLAVNQMVSIITNRQDQSKSHAGRRRLLRSSRKKVRDDEPEEEIKYDDVNDNSKKKTWELSQLVHNLSGGSPFFVIQLLKLLANEGLLQYDKAHDRWEWDEISVETKIRGSLLKESDSVADIVAGSMRRLPQKTLETLMIASCLGSDVPVHVLGEFFVSSKKKKKRKSKNKSNITRSGTKNSTNLFGDGVVGNDHIKRKSAETTVKACSACCPRCLNMEKKDLMEALDDAVESGMLRRSDRSGQTYRWSHDKLLDAAYSLISLEDSQSLHWRLGKLLLKMSTDYPTEEWMIYMAAYQFNKAQQCLSDDITSADLAKLNLRAAKLSIAKSAFYPAVDLLRAGTRHLKECPSTNHWKDHYAVCVELFNTLSEMEYLTGNRDACLDAVKEVVGNATCLQDKFRSQSRLLDCVSSGKSRDYAKGIQMSLDILSSYGVKLPIKKSQSRWLLFLESQRLKRALPNGRLESLLIMPKMIDPMTSQITKLLTEHLALYAINSGEMTTVRLASMQVMRLSAKHGINTNTCVAVQFFSLCEMLSGNFKESFRISTLAVNLCSRFNEIPGCQHAKIKGSANSSILAIMRPFHENLEGCIQAYRVGLRTGDMEFSSLSAMFYSLCYLCIGLPLGPLEPDLISFGQEATLFGRPLSIVVLFQIYRQTILNLQSCPVFPTILKGQAMDQDEILKMMDGKARSMTLRDICSFRLLLAVIYGDLKVAQQMVDVVSSFPYSDLVTFRGHLRVTYTGLAAMALGRAGDKKYATIGRSIINLVKVDVKNGAVNSYPILLMLQAEENPSKTRYDTAIKACGRCGLIQHKAYMYERAGLHLSLSQKGEGWSEYYLSRALSMYRDWGALGKVECMKREHPFLEESAGPSVTSFRSLKGRSRHEQRFADQIKRFSIGGSAAMTVTSEGTSLTGFSTSKNSSLTSRSLPASVPVMFRGQSK